MELIDRYVYAVTKRLPPKQRADIEKELRSLIEDMLAARVGGAAPTDKDIEAVLQEIGEPWKVAANYLNTKQYLISPQLYGVYTLVLRIVLACVAFGLTVAMIVSAVSNTNNLFGIFAQWLASLFNGGLCAFASVTLVFAIIDRVSDSSPKTQRVSEKIRMEFEKGMDEAQRSFHQNNQHHQHEPWHPHDLPRIPRDDARIRPSEPIAGIVFGCIWLAIINFAPWIIGAHNFANGQYSFTPFFALDVLKTYLVYINALGLFMIGINIAQLFVGHWNIPIALAKIVHNVFSAMLFINMFTNPALFDASFFERTAQLFHFSPEASSVMTIMDSVFFKVLFFVVLLGLFIDCITTLYKGIRGAVKD